MATPRSLNMRKEAAIERIAAATADLSGDAAADLRPAVRNRAMQEVVTLENIATRIEAMAAKMAKPAKAPRAKKTPAAVEAAE